jgi:polar amino acid transport system ATP-binding protein
MPPPVLSLSNIHKSFAGQAILRGISFEVPNTQVVAIIGPSGGGKSTLLRCINLLEAPDEGVVRLDGETLSRRNAARLAELRARMGMVFQLFNLFPHLTARQNVSLALKYSLKLKSDEADDRAAETLTRVGLAHKINAYPRHPSGGQQQRVAIAARS